MNKHIESDHLTQVLHRMNKFLRAVPDGHSTKDVRKMKQNVVYLLAAIEALDDGDYSYDQD